MIIKEEVQKLLEANIIEEIKKPEWLANVIIVPNREASGECVWTSLT